jgi:hypothetical protein
MANDLDPAGVPDDIPAKARNETFAYGLLRRGGSEKPAASAFRRYAAEGVLDGELNLGFERVGPYEGRLLPAYWRLFAEDRGEIAADAAVARTGRVSVRLRNTGGHGTDRVPALWIDPPHIAVVPGQVYVARAWARLDDATGGNRIAISWYDEKGGFLGQRESPWLPAGDLDWTPVQVEATAPPGAAALEVHLKSSDNTGTVWFDDVEIG